ncbi:hypothetical protein Athai_17260 [Actinocatenispora thailandica]|uniref:Mycothiol-dependent maleylpyruvate isomerase metal-binding domain-containing protein n=1 Tax=Actinocatenispora thailandica TaxID=227318 RepID=A0A7R7HWL1_9ACTN|nr:maleylpyruvate isomerase family mycothiol-dependent enzyme [Actinocatenispora thailandica]BCJ34223.1 hypothetical protein Athai_17260 [Actinocatenispora thailandica]
MTEKDTQPTGENTLPAEASMLQAETFAERERLAALLAGLSPQQWAAPSLCAGWRVREVVAHVTMPYRMASADEFQAALSAYGFDFDRYADAEARETTERLGDAELLALYRDNVRHPWQPPGDGPAGALSHEVIHGLDITEALGLPAVPTERIARVLEHVGTKNLAYFGTDLSGISLAGTDADVTVGDGTPVPAPVKEILLGITGRRPLPS